jgi:hypothetical protein
MPPKRHTLGVRRQIDREIKQVEKERDRLLAARAALDGKAVIPTEKAKRFSQDDVAAYLAEHPESTYTEVAAGLGASPINVAAHLSRGQKASRFRNSDGKWSLK